MVVKVTKKSQPASEKASSKATVKKKKSAIKKPPAINIEDSILEVTTFLETENSEKLILKETNVSQIPAEFPRTGAAKEKVYNSISIQIKDLNDRIKQTDKKASVIKAKFEKMEKITNKLASERVSVRLRIKEDQDSIEKLEQKLGSIKIGQYRPSQPYVVRILIGLFTKIPDEILLKTSITKHEVRFAQRETRLVIINHELANSWLISKAAQDNFTELDKLTEFFRASRKSLGRSKRDIEASLKTEKNKENESLVMSDYFENIQKLNQLGPDFTSTFSLNKSTLLGLFDNDKLEDIRDESIQKLSSNVNQELEQMAEFLSNRNIK